MSPDDPMERRLAAALHTQLDALTIRDDLVSGAVQRSRRIRRTRKAAVTAASVAAALAIATPVAWSGLRTPQHLPAPGSPSLVPTGRATSPEPSTSSLPSSTTTAPAPSTPPPTHMLGAPLRQVVASLDDPSGTPDVPYLHGTTVHDGDRTVRLRLPERSPHTFRGLFTDGTVLVNVLNASGTWDLVWFDRAGTEISREADGMMAVLDSDRSQVAWVDAEDRIHLSDAQGNEVATWSQQGLYPTGVANGRVYANDTQQRAVVLDSRSDTSTTLDGISWGPVHAGTGLAIARERGRDNPTCYRLVELATLRQRWTICGSAGAPGPFSPDGRFLVVAGGQEGDPHHEFSVLRVLDGEPVLGVRTGTGPLALDGAKAVNATGTAVTVVATNVAAVGQQSSQALLRCSLDGTGCSVVGAAEPMPTDSVGNPAGVWGLAPAAQTP
ncbi:MAG TPA: hypothetical protein VFM07_05470 [Intrasporangium sp.]|nr:hypothetical protein [Intrasporangium sp.]